jgi:hypothetical protein
MRRALAAHAPVTALLVAKVGVDKAVGTLEDVKSADG